MQRKFVYFISAVVVVVGVVGDVGDDGGGLRSTLAFLVRLYLHRFALHRERHRAVSTKDHRKDSWPGKSLASTHLEAKRETKYLVRWRVWLRL